MFSQVRSTLCPHKRNSCQTTHPKSKIITAYNMRYTMTSLYRKKHLRAVHTKKENYKENYKYTVHTTTITMTVANDIVGITLRVV